MHTKHWFHINICKAREYKKLNRSRATKKEISFLKEKYNTCPTSQCEYEIDGKKYIVTRHLVGNKQLDRIITELAIKQANREMGL